MRWLDRTLTPTGYSQSRTLGCLADGFDEEHLRTRMGSTACCPWICWGAAVLMLGVTPCISYAAASQVQGPVILLPPVTPACVSSPFGPRIMPGRPLAGTFHSGIDLPAPVGSAVRAVAPGTIIRVHRRGVGGLEILIQHAGFIGIYSHLGLIAPALAEGRTAIHGGEKIATVGRTGLTYGAHLYFEMTVDGHPVNPAPYLRIFPCESAAPARH